ncbi:uncharacterized protein LOC123867083 isoform X2 [Maniola jurtina]|uniref:uncharacterized protein LOC123867083 isoform X2 n=1 Tax=Maniola jurtina TaxID=191418 RepID=UPI001E68B855|nr:uncharacterized protein LOC123867083 isoform X2 [Maniola jurtina]
MTRGRCVVPGCSNLGHHIIPTVNSRKSLWMKAMKLEGQILKFKRPSVCKLHFKETDYMDSDYIVKMRNRNLKRHAVPSIFPWNDEPPTKETFISQEEINSDSKSEMKNVESRAPLLTDNDNTTEKLSSEIQPSSSLEKEKDIPRNSSGVNKSHITQNMPFRYELTPGTSDPPCEELSDARFQKPPSEKQQSSRPNNSFAEIEIDIGNAIETTESVKVKQEKDIGNVNEATVSVEVKQEKDNENVTESVTVKQNPFTITEPCASCGHLPYYSVHSYKNEPNGLSYYTGFETFDKLISVFNSLGDGVNNLDYVYGPPPDHLDTLEQFCMVLLWLSKHREFQDVALTYRTSTKQVANILIAWIRFMALQWRAIKLKIDRKAVSYYMSLDYNDKYPYNRVIIDANECLDKPPRLLSAYENKNTIKLLIGMAPNGLITYLSPCSGDSDSDRQLDERSSSNDEMMDKELNVQDIFLSHGIKVGPIPSKKYNKVIPDILTKASKIANKKVHIEGILEMLKSYKILTQPMTPIEKGVSNEIAFVVAMLVNFRSNFIK